MKIALIAPFEETVPPQRYGGIEVVVGNLADELINLGHEVTLFAVGGSQTKAKLVKIFPRPTRSLRASTSHTYRDSMTFVGISRLLKILNQEEFDIIHNHLGWRFLFYSDSLNGSKILTTLHLSLYDPVEKKFYNMLKRKPYVSLSKAQRLPMPNLNYIANVYNGIDVKNFSYSKKPGEYLAFLGSIIEHKGPDTAIQVARKTKSKLVIAAKVDPLQRKYFDERIRPHIDGDQIKFIGEVGHEEKVAFLKRARALLMPVRWHEPFGLVMAESLACGTPVIALRKGSTSEVIEDGVTGYICSSIREMCERVSDIDSIDRMTCRQSARDRFSSNHMAREYVRVYKKLAAQ